MHTPEPVMLSLVSRAQTGDAEAWAALYQRYHPMVFHTAYLLLGDIGRAEEFTQDVFVQVYRTLSQYTPERAAFTTWLHHITVNLCLNARRRRLLRWVSWDRLVGDDVQMDLPGPSTVEMVLQTETQREVWQAVQQLPLKLRAAAVLRYYHDLSYDEIAQALGCPIGTVRSRLAAAHARLRNALEE